MKKFEDMQLDVLKEIGNIGAGNAATALSNLLQRNIDMKVPDVNVLSFDDIADYVGGPEEVVISIFLRIEGDVPGNMFFILTQEGAKKLLQSILGITNEDAFSEMEISALQEVGNILSGSYLSALADFTQLELQPSVPSLAIDMAIAIISYGLIESSKAGDYALVIDTMFSDISNSQKEEIKGQFFLLPDPDSFSRLFNALGVPFNE